MCKHISNLKHLLYEYPNSSHFLTYIGCFLSTYCDTHHQPAEPLSADFIYILRKYFPYSRCLNVLNVTESDKNLDNNGLLLSLFCLWSSTISNRFPLTGLFTSPHNVKGVHDIIKNSIHNNTITPFPQTHLRDYCNRPDISKTINYFTKQQLDTFLKEKAAIAVAHRIAA